MCGQPSSCFERTKSAYPRPESARGAAETYDIRHIPLAHRAGGRRQAASGPRRARETGCPLTSWPGRGQTDAPGLRASRSSSATCSQNTDLCGATGMHRGNTCRDHPGPSRHVMCARSRSRALTARGSGRGQWRAWLRCVFQIKRAVTGVSWLCYPFWKTPGTVCACGGSPRDTRGCSDVMKIER